MFDQEDQSLIKALNIFETARASVSMNRKNKKKIKQRMIKILFAYILLLEDGSKAKIKS